MVGFGRRLVRHAGAFGVWSFRIRVQGLGFRASGFELRAFDLELRRQGSGFKITAQTKKGQLSWRIMQASTKGVGLSTSITMSLWEVCAGRVGTTWSCRT